MAAKHGRSTSLYRHPEMEHAVGKNVAPDSYSFHVQRSLEASNIRGRQARIPGRDVARALGLTNSRWHLMAC